MNKYNVFLERLENLLNTYGVRIFSASDNFVFTFDDGVICDLMDIEHGVGVKDLPRSEEPERLIKRIPWNAKETENDLEP